MKPACVRDCRHSHRKWLVYLRCYVVVLPEMSATLIPAPDIQYKLAAPVGEDWRRVLERLRRPRVQPSGQRMTDCFGKLTDKDEMVVKGLGVSLACSIEREQGRR